MHMQIRTSRVLPLPAKPLAARQARIVLSWCLDDWGLLHLSGEAEIVVSELVTNALRETHRVNEDHFTISFTTDGAALRVEVWDPSDKLPERQDADPMSTGGRGLEIVAFCCKEFEVIKGATSGKTVCALLT